MNKTLPRDEAEARDLAIAHSHIFSITHQQERYIWNAAKEFYQPKWNRIEDGLPEEDGYYLAQIDPEYSSVPFAVEHFFAETNRFHNTHILAWMPLPAPYQPQQLEESL